MTAIVLRGDAAALPLADESVDLIVTSPPYFGLRSYSDGGAHYAGQVGDEATPAEYLDALAACTAEWVRVLKPGGSIFVNLGDSYARQGQDKPQSCIPGDVPKAQRQRLASQAGGVRLKSLMGMPWRYAIRCVDQLGLILRAEIIWCLSGGARVYARTPTGDRPVMLRDLVRSYRPDDIQLWNGERWTQVRGWNRTPDDDGALELELRTGERIGCTPGHKWPTQRGVIRADEVRVGDVIATTRLPEPDRPRTPALLPDEDIGWLVGLYIAEGSRSETTVQIAGHARETARHARLTRIAAALDGTCAVYYSGENTANATLRGSVIGAVLDRYVSRGTAKTKRLQHAAWQRSDRFLAAVVEGYLSGDGHYDAKNDRWRLGFTENDEWAADLRTLAARLGAVCRLRRYAHQGFGETFPGWRGDWRWTRSAHRNAKPDGEVVAIRRSRARDFYDLGVADDPHLFALSSGVLTHNSKPNGLPESVTDRVRRSHEQVFHFVKSPRYYSAVDEVREEQIRAEHHARYSRHYDAATADGKAMPGTRKGWGGSAGERGLNPLGKLPGSVWTIPDDGPTLARSVLQAVSAGALTIDEAERILTCEPTSSGAEWTAAATAAGPGSATSTAKATADTARSAAAPAGHTASPTNSPSDPSQTGSPSTTSADCDDAADQPTSSPSPSRPTSPADPDRAPAPQGTASMSATPTSGGTGAASAGRAWPPGPAPTAPGSVWEIPTQPLRVPESLGIDHFAAFPSELVKRIVAGWSPREVCCACGEGRRPVAQQTDEAYAAARRAVKRTTEADFQRHVGRSSGVSASAISNGVVRPDYRITGYACGCPDTSAPTAPGLVLDPFGGTGTTALVASCLGRVGITNDMSWDYCRLARWRTTDPGERARVLEVPKPEKPVEGQLGLFEGLGA